MIPVVQGRGKDNLVVRKEHYYRSYFVFFAVPVVCIVRGKGELGQC